MGSNPLARQALRFSDDPLAGMAAIAMDEVNPPELRGRMYAELAQYVAPRLKAVERSGETEPQEIVIRWLGAS